MLGIVFLFLTLCGLFTVVSAVWIFWQAKRLPRLIELLPILVLPVLITGLCCGLPLSVPVILNNQRLQNFANNLYIYPLPPQTEVVDSYEEIGLMGNGNHCDFVVVQNLVSRLSREEIETYYRDVEFPGARNADRKIDVIVDFGDTPPIETGLYFNLTIIDYDNPTDFDFRCH